ncbi:MAG: LytTR family transcriptional regulator DNA-binding domain-containing protein [Sphingopyxis sp.]|nr:LytTR family transcriptional regulator DNA-binding domain-containing protein [Sphingopyxis sp.]
MTVSRSANSQGAGLGGGEARARWIIIGGIIVIATLTGPFATMALPLPSRALFWAALIGWNGAKWEAWIGWVMPRLAHHPRAQIAALIAGPLLINATMPWEVELAYAAVGRPIDLPAVSIWLMASCISLVVAVVLHFVQRPGAAGPASPPADGADVPRAAALSPLLTKAKLASAADILAIVAEDHYIRLHLANGQQPLLLYRFGDALADMALADGAQVHRSVWVAASAVTGAHREGRNWRLRLSNGAMVPVGGSFAAAARGRGWLAR